VTSRPHDALFKAVFSDPANAAGELRSVLPKAIVDATDWSTLTLEPGSFVDDELSDRHTDLLFSANRRGGGTALVYLLFEHQSSPDPWMALRLLVYMVRVWESYRKAQAEAKSLPPVVPVVLYQGDTGWATRTLAGLVEGGDAFAAFVPDFAFVLDDLRGASDEALRDRAISVHAKVALALMREARTDGALVDVLVRWMEELRELQSQPTGASALGLLLRYIAEVRDGSIEGLRATVRQLGPVAEEAMMTMAEQWRQEGKAEGRAESIFAVLSARSLAVTADLRARVLACRDVAVLDRWLAAAVTATSADDIFV
jgi:predicted transposase/invertase (TIGR01784 family)